MDETRSIAATSDAGPGAVPKRTGAFRGRGGYKSGRELRSSSVSQRRQTVKNSRDSDYLVRLKLEGTNETVFMEKGSRGRCNTKGRGFKHKDLEMPPNDENWRKRREDSECRRPRDSKNCLNNGSGSGRSRSESTCRRSQYGHNSQHNQSSEKPSIRDHNEKGETQNDLGKNCKIPKHKGRTNRSRVMVLNMNDLNDLLCEEPSVIILSLVAPQNGLEARLTNEKLQYNMTRQLIMVLARAFSSSIHPENQHQLMSMLLASNLFTVHIPIMVANLHKDEGNVFHNLATIFLALLRKMPTSAANSLSPCVTLCIQFIQQQRCESPYHKSVILEMSSIQAEIIEIFDENSKQAKAQSKIKRTAEENSNEPPEDFRELPIIPDVAEITTNIKPFLRQNILTGKYKDVNHYLDVQFRLLREDFVAPLREGINEYVRRYNSQDKSWKHARQDVHIYEEVKVGDPYCTKDGILHTLYFNSLRFRHINWETSRRLIYGSLLCLSADNFKSVLFATVLNRDLKDLKLGIIKVQFAEDDVQVELSHQQQSMLYVMVESPAYFEAYRHVLRGLQLCGNEMPLKNYIIYLDRILKPPRYLYHDTLYDMACVLKSNSNNSYCSRKISFVEKGQKKIRYRDYFGNVLPHRKPNETRNEPEHDECNPKHNQNKNVGDSLEEDNVYFSAEENILLKTEVNKKSLVVFSRVLDLHSWPKSNDIGLDESQIRAMHLALTSSLAIIQGPPGTGKTYIGLKIVRVLLHNHSVWDNYGVRKPAPILVVCYTNHALDQFLEGTLPFTKRLVRIGNRSKSVKLDTYNIRNLRYLDDHHRNLDDRSCFDTQEIRSKLSSINTQIREVGEHIQQLKSHILNESTLEKMLTGEDKRLLLSLKNNFEERFGVSPENELYPTSFLPSWLGLNFGAFVSEKELEAFSMSKIDVVQAHETIKPTPSAQHSMMSETNSAQIVPSDDFNDVRGVAATELHKRLLDDEIPDITSFPAMATYRKELWAVTVAKLSDPSYHFPGATFEPQFKALYTSKGLIRKTIAERELQRTDFASITEVSQMTSAWDLTIAERWCLYRRWAQLFHGLLRGKKINLKKQYQCAARCLAEAVNGESLEIMRQSDIVGMTTTGAAKYHAVLQELGPKIVIVEEAAEVLESHIVTSLSRHTQHLILIGDQQQLRPTTTVYKLAKNYQLDISLFERMVKNGIHYETLQLQHRMRPEISRLLVPLFYANLEDHPSVKLYENIKGVTTNVFFLDHSNSERLLGDSMSRVNDFEAEYLVSLCLYLIQQGYKRENITILAAYSGQQFAIQKLLNTKDEKKKAIKDKKKTKNETVYDKSEKPKEVDEVEEIDENVRVTVVDNYQGEENDIILLSFVRSNEEGVIGFLGTENRVNVALSRAKKGLYCVGNFTLLAGKSEFWRQLVATLERDGNIGHILELTCQKHPSTIAHIKHGEDFTRFAPEGGCLKFCTEQLICGHICTRMCHNDEHKCLEPCPEILCDRNHPCPLLCYEDCKPCNVLVLKQFPICSHNTNLECHRDISEVVCTTIVERTLDHCGHSVKLHCYIDPLTYTCTEIVVRLLDCGHTVNLECHENPSMHNCLTKVTRVLGCNHSVELPCHVDARTYECKQEVTHLFQSCQHKVKILCYLINEELSCPCDCNFRLPCGHVCPRKCHPTYDLEHKKITCKKQCQKTCTAGHQCKKLCSENCSLCSIRIKKELPCGHKVAVECYKNVEDVTCNEVCNRKLGCEHLCKQLCSEKCGKCEVLVEKAIPKCEHVQRMKCMDDPTLASCTARCERLLPCGHPCFFMCGVPCSQQCLIPFPTAGLCRHSVSVPCHAKKHSAVMQTYFCKTLCNQLLPCGHYCKGSCGTCHQGRVHIPCYEKCTRVQICGHPCELLCHQRCMPCKRNCSVRCPHSRCSQKCGQPCTKCKMPCNWSCKHFSCNKLCGELCTRPRCNVPCYKTLHCGHNCIGLCAERCPNLCHVCHKDKLMKSVLFGYGYTEVSRFIQLEPCGHCIDVRALDYWMATEDNTVQLKGCPVCKTTVWYSGRYRNKIRLRLREVQDVQKRVLCGNKSTSGTIRRLEKILTKAYRIHDFHHEEIKMLLDVLSRQSNMQLPQLVVMENQINILNLMSKMRKIVLTKDDEVKDYFDVTINRLRQRLLQNKQQVTQYELSQINRETCRVYYQAVLVEHEKQMEQKGGTPTEYLTKTKALTDSGWKITDSVVNPIKLSLEKGTSHDAFGFVDQERVELLSVPSVSADDWRKCLRGHIYAADNIDPFNDKRQGCGQCIDT